MQKIQASMTRKYHNHTPQTNQKLHEKEPHNNHKTQGRQTKWSKQLSLSLHLIKMIEN